VRRTKREAYKRSNEIIKEWVTGTALIGWIPGSPACLGAGDIKMIRQVADVFGMNSFDEAAIKAHFTGIFDCILGGVTSAELVGLIPVAGWVVKSDTLVVKVRLIGDEVINYFNARSPLSD